MFRVIKNLRRRFEKLLKNNITFRMVENLRNGNLLIVNHCEGQDHSQGYVRINSE